MMTGRDLYAKYVRYQGELSNCSVDSWEELTVEDQRVWEAMAYDIEDEFNEDA